MGLIAFVGDCHYKFYQMFDAMVGWEARTGRFIDAIVQIGDFGIDHFNPQWKHLWNEDREVPIETYVCPGNHEDYGAIKDWMNEPDRIQGLHLLPDGGITDVAGLKVGSVWGNYSPKSWYYPDIVNTHRTYNVPGSLKKMHIFRPAVEQLLAYDGVMDILITHDCSAMAPPSKFAGRPVHPDIGAILGLDSDEQAPPGCPGFDALINKFKPLYHFYGHFHVRDGKKIDNTWIQCLHAFDMKPTEAVEIVEFNMNST